MAKRKKKTDPSIKKSKTIDGKVVAESQGEFWAEAILDWGLHNGGSMMYLIKWEGYPQSDNSWEMQQNVRQCDDLLIDFHSNHINGRQPPKWSFDEFEKFYKCIENLVETQDLVILRKLLKHKLNSFEIKDKPNIEEIKALLRTQLNLISVKLKKKTNSKRLEAIETIKKVINNLNINQNFGSISQFLEFVDKRHVVSKQLLEWEQQINEVILRTGEGKPVRVVNDIDLEKPILKEYITDFIIDVQFEDRIKLENERPLISCQCSHCFQSNDECCTHVFGFPMVYDKSGLLNTESFNTIIFECNSECQCSQDCPNRQIQKGRQFELEIFRTDSKTRGWGVRCLQFIPKGSFITQYTGEVISTIEAEKRPSDYLFDLSSHLDSNDEDFTYVVDASNYGNVTRFVNHCCSPNCRVLFAWIQRSANKLLPIIALFAEQDIQINEELTYDYSMEYIENCDQSDIKLIKRTISETKLADRPKPRRVGFKRIECECGSDDCRNFLYS